MHTPHATVISAERLTLIRDAVEKALAMMTLLHIAGIQANNSGRNINLIEDIKRLRVALRLLDADAYNRH